MMTIIHRNILLFRTFIVKSRGFCETSNKLTVEWYKTDKIDASNLKKFVSGDETISKLQDILRSVQHAVRKDKSPKLICEDQIKILCVQENNNQRRKYLHFLFKKERVKIADAKKKERKRIERINCFQPKHIENSEVTYGLGKNSILLNVRDYSYNRFYRHRLANSVLFGKKIVIDLDYDLHMIEKERKECAAQLQVIFSNNRKNIDPFDLYFCNANPDAYCVKYFKQGRPTFSESLITLTEKNYLDLFPKENLVYLSPHAKETLKEYDENAIYIIGGFVDTVKRKQISLNKAESQGIKSFSLPLDDYITWKAGSKSLTINQAFQIMLTLKNTKDWFKALECVPSRKIIGWKPQNDMVVDS